MEINLSPYLVKLDRAMDYVPVVSAVNNLIDIFQKCLLDLTRKIPNNAYYAYLNEKKYSRCFLLLIPAIGNLALAILNCRSKKTEKEGGLLSPLPSSQISIPPEDKKWLDDLKVDGMELQCAPQRFKESKSAVLTAVANIGRALQFAENKLKTDMDIIKAAVSNDAGAYLYVPEYLLSKDQILEIVETNGLVLQHTKQKGEDAFILKAVKQNPAAFSFIPKDKLENKDLIEKAVQINAEVFKYTHYHVRNDSSFVKSLMAISPKVISYATPEVQKLLTKQ